MRTDTNSSTLSPHSLKSILKNFFFTCCFRRNHHDHRQVLSSPLPQVNASSTPSDDRPTLIWLNTNATRDLKHEIKDRCVTVFSCMGSGISRHRRCNSAEFRYDPLSYSLNFEDGGFDRDDDTPLGNLCPRLTPYPPVKSVAANEITAAN